MGNVYTFIHPRGELSLMFRKMEVRNKESLPPADNFTPILGDAAHPWGSNVASRVKLKIGLKK
jgi:hypothetical protein